MANKEQRGNREKKKPKKEKPKPAAQTSSFSQGTYGSKGAASPRIPSRRGLTARARTAG